MSFSTWRERYQLIQSTLNYRARLPSRESKSITYDTFNKPTRIAGASITDFYYGPDHELYKEVSGSKTTYKLAGGMYEVIVDGTTTTQKSYVDGVILNNRVLLSGTPSANDTLYLHTDHLGSVEATTNALGQFVNRMSFSTWGKRQQSDWKPGNPTESFATSNGYTGHDQLDAHNLIHMGGRVYDPSLGRFLSADLFVQSPYDSQSFNRYSYTFNNPLSYTDPTGYMSDMFTWAMNQSYAHSSSWMWSSSVYQAQMQIDPPKEINWTTRAYDSDGNFLGEKHGQTVIQPNEVSAATIFQTVSYNRASWGVGFGRIYNLEPGIQQKCGSDANCAQQERVNNAVDFLNLATLPYVPVRLVGAAAKIDKAADALKTGKTSTHNLLKNAGTTKSGLKVDNGTLQQIGAAEARGGKGFSGLTPKVEQSKPATWHGEKTGGTQTVIKYQNANGQTKFTIHTVTDGSGRVVHRDFDSVLIQSGQQVVK
jgi:RHS repeat-associated protein